MKMICISNGSASFILNSEEIKIPLVYGKTYISGDVLDMYDEYLWIYEEIKTQSNGLIQSALLDKKHFVTVEQWREMQLNEIL